MSILWTIIIGFVAGLIAKFLHPGSKNEPSDFILTTLLGRGSICCDVPWPSDRVVQSWGRCRFHRSNRWCNHSAGSLGDFCKSSRPTSLRNRRNFGFFPDAFTHGSSAAGRPSVSISDRNLLGHRAALSHSARWQVPTRRLDPAGRGAYRALIHGGRQLSEVVKWLTSAR